MASENLIRDTRVHDKNAFAAYREHTSQERIQTKSAVLNILRDSYPLYHVTEVNEGECSLLEYAKAGHAKSTFVPGDDSFDATRKWQAVGTGVEKKLNRGTLKDEVRFARFHYVWENSEYFVYHAVYQDAFFPRASLLYILYPNVSHGVSSSGYCSETDELILTCGRWTSQLHDEIWVFDNGCWGKSKELWTAVAESSWDDVILDADMKKGLMEDVQGFFDNREVYRRFAVPWKRGVILHGVPGNGKTISLKALINTLYKREDHISSLYVKSIETKSNTEQYAIRSVFKRAREAAPCLLIFEDLDSLVGDKVRSYFLNEVDGLESNDGILMIGSTNHLNKLDPAIAKRPSRFDRKYHFKLPNASERYMYAQYWRKKLTSDDQVVDFPLELCDVISKLTEGFSFAYLKELFVMSLLSLVRGFKGEEFEMVEAAEAASTTTSDDNPSSLVDKADAEEVCKCRETCAHCLKPKKSTKQKTLQYSAADTRHIPVLLAEVEEPAQLANSLLLKVIKHHIRVLHSEMDNSKA